jgi:rod shape-determining protein MreD
VNLLYFLVLFCVSLVLQSSVIPLIVPYWFGAGMDLTLMVVVYIAITRGKVAGMTTGLVLGYLQDALSGGILGVNGLSRILAGYTGGYLKNKFFIGSTTHRIGVVLGTVLVAVVSRIAALAVFSLPLPVLSPAFILWAVLGNTIFSIGMYFILEKIEVRIGVRSEDEITVGGP